MINAANDEPMKVLGKVNHPTKCSHCLSEVGPLEAVRFYQYDLDRYLTICIDKCEPAEKERVPFFQLTVATFIIGVMIGAMA